MKLRNTLIGISTDNVWLDGLLSHAPDVRALAVILQPDAADPAHAREAAIARSLQSHGFATLTLNLLTHYEQTRDPDARFNVPQLANRVVAAAEWIGHQPPLTPLAIGLFASDTTCAAAIRAAVRIPERIGAIVCQAGRPDLAGAAQLRALHVPTRFIVGRDNPQAAMLHQAYGLIGGTHDWQAIDGNDPAHAGDHEIEQTGRLAAEWLQQHLPLPRAAESAASPGEQPPLPHPGPA
ncbi:hypothetical protein CJ010_11735 [Azoarcus sp. DD4]|uniref:alpha/beta hydrolase n=1 Tax=Azoarcus sp. DD4 TaxID=2027405 RepID=UPI00112691B0|nr:alpha/beta hydrolase [Azoarcus sp. DD4]QDF97148.1 hypothetical protein CJ010_11735 [Azoarcus sp. DD4]